jgi:hypothetical protein
VPLGNGRRPSSRKIYGGLAPRKFVVSLALQVDHTWGQVQPKPYSHNPWYKKRGTPTRHSSERTCC